MINLYFLICFTALTSPLAFAIDNPNSSDYIAQFEASEKALLKAIQNPSNGTRDTIRAYHEYKLFLDKELNKAYKIVKSNLSIDRQKELTTSQRNWIKFRDTEFELINNNWTRSSFGSSFAISRGDYSSAVIRNRVIRLLHYAKNY